ELMGGEEIVERIERDGVFTVEELSLIVHQLGSALDALHTHGIIHRDIKAENVFIAGEEEQIQIKLYDFGLAKRPGEKDARKMLTGMGVMVGTAEYMSPEQIVSSRDVDHYADLWAFAVLTYVTMCGGLPFHGTNLIETFAEVKEGRFERPSTIRDDIGPAIDSWFVRAFHMERNKRFATASEMMQAWNAAVAGGAVAIPATVPPVAGRPPPSQPGQAPMSGQVAAFPGAFASAPPQPHGAYPQQAHGMMPPPGPPGMAPGPMPPMPPPMMAQPKSGPSPVLLAVIAVVVVALTVVATLFVL
ncbi:MAG: serine/threonine-protein kinase, partial [Pseudomonadota bacterium]